MNNQAKNLFERALETRMIFGTRKSSSAVCFENAVIIKRNFAGKDIPCKDRNGRSFVKKGRRFTLVLTEDMFNALKEAKGDCSYGIWQFAPDENPELKVYTVEVNIKMESNNPPTCALYTKNNGRVNVSVLDSTSIGILDEIYECDIERIDITVNPYDPDKVGHFTLWLRDIKLSQNEIEDSDAYWNNMVAGDNVPYNADPNQD